MPVEPKLAEDLLTTAQEIADYLGWPVHRIYYAVRRGLLPIGKVGELLIARKSELDRKLSGEAAMSAKEVA
jgi:hypothetical protein